MADSLMPAHIRISYDLLKEVLKLPEDVNILGIHGIDDSDGSFPLLVETPVKHIKRDRLKVRYKRSGDEAVFDGFE